MKNRKKYVFILSFFFLKLDKQKQIYNSNKSVYKIQVKHQHQNRASSTHSTNGIRILTTANTFLFLCNDCLTLLL